MTYISALSAVLLLLQAFAPNLPGDTRLQSVDYQADRVVMVEAAPGYAVTVLLSPDERVESIAVGDSSAWQVSANAAGNHLFIKLAQPGLATNMTVITNVRLYAFELVPLGSASQAMTYTLQFRYPTTPVEEQLEGPLNIVTSYKVSGSKSLWPSSIGDDGEKTYIVWSLDQDIPAVYALDHRGKEVLVNGMMRDDEFVIDAVADRLVFRIDNRTARAKRLAERTPEK